MKREVFRPKSQLAKLKASIAKAVPGGLPKSVAELYAKSDGLETTIDGESATLVGLNEMFGGHFAPPVTIKRADDAEDVLANATFAEELFSTEMEVASKADVARANLLLRLKLLARFAGESVAFAVDYCAGDKEPVLYVVDLFDQAFPLELGFTDFVTLFEKFGTSRWYYAFLGAKAGRVMNVDLAAEFDASMARFDDPEVAALRGQLERGAKPGAWKAALAKTTPAKKAPAEKKKKKVEKKK